MKPLPVKTHQHAFTLISEEFSTAAALENSSNALSTIIMSCAFRKSILKKEAI